MSRVLACVISLTGLFFFKKCMRQEVWYCFTGDCRSIKSSRLAWGQRTPGTMNNILLCNTTFQIGLLPPMYGIEMCVALVGNIFALWLLVTKERQNWHTGVVFSCNLAICDILYVLTLPLLIIYYANEKQWSFGDTACKIERFLFSCNLYGSIFFIMCISVNRYLAIVFPFFTRSYVRPKHAKIASVLTWSIVIIASSPVLKFAGTEVKQTHTLCVSSHDETLRNPHFKYTLFLMVVGCMIPLLVTFASYLGVIWTVLKNKNITALEKRKVALMVALVCILYATSFVPYHVLQTYHVFLKSIKMMKCDVYNSYQVSKGLATLNMCLHPLLYMAVFDSIRTACCGKSSDD